MYSIELDLINLLNNTLIKLNINNKYTAIYPLDNYAKYADSEIYYLEGDTPAYLTSQSMLVSVLQSFEEYTVMDSDGIICIFRSETMDDLLCEYFDSGFWSKRKQQMSTKENVMRVTSNQTKDKIINDLPPILKTPYSKLNNALGDFKGFRRGEFVVIGSFKYNYRIGFIEDLFLGCALCNSPHMLDDTKKPLIINIGFGNQEVQHFRLGRRYHEMTGQALTNASKFNILNYECINICVTEYNVDKLISYVQDREQEGYEIHLITIDDIEKFENKDGNDGIENHTSKNIQRLRDFFYPRNTTVITSYEILPELSIIRTTHPTGYLESIANVISRSQDPRISLYVDTELLISMDNEGTYNHKISTYLAKRRGSTTYKQQSSIPFNYDGVLVVDAMMIDPSTN